MYTFLNFIWKTNGEKEAERWLRTPAKLPGTVTSPSQRHGWHQGFPALKHPCRLPNTVSGEGTESERGYADENRTHSKGSVRPAAGSLSSDQKHMRCREAYGNAGELRTHKAGARSSDFFLPSDPSIYSNKVHKRSYRARDKEKPQIKLQGTMVSAEAGTYVPAPPAEGSHLGFRKAPGDRSDLEKQAVQAHSRQLQCTASA